MPPALAYIIAATIVASLVSLALAAALSFRWLSSLVDRMVCVSAMAHENPHEIGDFMILLNAGFSRRKAFRFMLLSGAASVVGGIVGFAVLDATRGMLPYALTIAAASFIYIALSDLLPEIMRRTSLAKTIPEVALVFLGVAIGAGGLALLHGH